MGVSLRKGPNSLTYNPPAPEAPSTPRTVADIIGALDPRWTEGYHAARDLMDEIHPEDRREYAAKLLTVTPDPEDDPVYDAGFRGALRIVRDRY